MVLFFERCQGPSGVALFGFLGDCFVLFSVSKTCTCTYNGISFMTEVSFSLLFFEMLLPCCVFVFLSEFFTLETRSYHL